MTLGLIWTLILHFQLAKHLERSGRCDLKQIKESLLLWCQNKIKHIEIIIEIVDFHQSWQNGWAFIALVKSFRPEAIDIEQLKRKENRELLAIAFDTAYHHLLIPKILDVDDVCEAPDENSILTYISYFYNLHARTKNSETSVKRVKYLLNNLEEMDVMKANYIRQSKELIEWIELQSRLFERFATTTANQTLVPRAIANEIDDEKNIQIQMLKFSRYFSDERFEKLQLRNDCETLYFEIVSMQKQAGLRRFFPKQGLRVNDIERSWIRLELFETDHLVKLKTLAHQQESKLRCRRSFEKKSSKIDLYLRTRFDLFGEMFSIETVGDESSISADVEWRSLQMKLLKWKSICLDTIASNRIKTDHLNKLINDQIESESATKEFYSNYRDQVQNKLESIQQLALENLDRIDFCDKIFFNLSKINDIEADLKQTNLKIIGSNHDLLNKFAQSDVQLAIYHQEKLRFHETYLTILNQNYQDCLNEFEFILNSIQGSSLVVIDWLKFQQYRVNYQNTRRGLNECHQSMQRYRCLISNILKYHDFKLGIESLQEFICRSLSILTSDSSKLINESNIHCLQFRNNLTKLETKVMENELYSICSKGYLLINTGESKPEESKLIELINDSIEQIGKEFKRLIVVINERTILLSDCLNLFQLVNELCENEIIIDQLESIDLANYRLVNYDLFRYDLLHLCEIFDRIDNLGINCDRFHYPFYNHPNYSQTLSSSSQYLNYIVYLKNYHLNQIDLQHSHVYLIIEINPILERLKLLKLHHFHSNLSDLIRTKQKHIKQLFHSTKSDFDYGKLRKLLDSRCSNDTVSDDDDLLIENNDDSIDELLSKQSNEIEKIDMIFNLFFESQNLSEKKLQEACRERKETVDYDYLNMKALILSIKQTLRLIRICKDLGHRWPSKEDLIEKSSPKNDDQLVSNESKTTNEISNLIDRNQSATISSEVVVETESSKFLLKDAKNHENDDDEPSESIVNREIDQSNFENFPITLENQNYDANYQNQNERRERRFSLKIRNILGLLQECLHEMSIDSKKTEFQLEFVRQSIKNNVKLIEIEIVENSSEKNKSIVPNCDFSVQKHHPHQPIRSFSSELQHCNQEIYNLQRLSAFKSILEDFDASVVVKLDDLECLKSTANCFSKESLRKDCDTLDTIEILHRIHFDSLVDFKRSFLNDVEDGDCDDEQSFSFTDENKNKNIIKHIEELFVILESYRRTIEISRRLLQTRLKQIQSQTRKKKIDELMQRYQAERLKLQPESESTKSDQFNEAKQIILMDIVEDDFSNLDSDKFTHPQEESFQKLDGKQADIDEIVLSIEVILFDAECSDDDDRVRYLSDHFDQLVQRALDLSGEKRESVVMEIEKFQRRFDEIKSRKVNTRERQNFEHSFNELSQLISTDQKRIDEAVKTVKHFPLTPSQREQLKRLLLDLKASFHHHRILLEYHRRNFDDNQQAEIQSKSVILHNRLRELKCCLEDFVILLDFDESFLEIHSKISAIIILIKSDDDIGLDRLKTIQLELKHEQSLTRQIRSPNKLIDQKFLQKEIENLENLWFQAYILIRFKILKHRFLSNVVRFERFETYDSNDEVIRLFIDDCHRQSDEIESLILNFGHNEEKDRKILNDTLDNWSILIEKLSSSATRLAMDSRQERDSFVIETYSKQDANNNPLEIEQIEFVGSEIETIKPTTTPYRIVKHRMIKSSLKDDVALMKNEDGYSEEVDELHKTNIPFDSKKSNRMSRNFPSSTTRFSTRKHNEKSDDGDKEIIISYEHLDEDDSKTLNSQSQFNEFKRIDVVYDVENDDSQLFLAQKDLNDNESSENVSVLTETLSDIISRNCFYDSEDVKYVDIVVDLASPRKANIIKHKYLRMKNEKRCLQDDEEDDNGDELKSFEREEIDADQIEVDVVNSKFDSNSTKYIDDDLNRCSFDTENFDNSVLTEGHLPHQNIPSSIDYEMKSDDHLTINDRNDLEIDLLLNLNQSDKTTVTDLKETFQSTNKSKENDFDSEQAILRFNDSSSLNQKLKDNKLQSKKKRNKNRKSKNEEPYQKEDHLGNDFFNIDRIDRSESVDLNHQNLQDSNPNLTKNDFEQNVEENLRKNSSMKHELSRKSKQNNKGGRNEDELLEIEMIEYEESEKPKKSKDHLELRMANDKVQFENLKLHCLESNPSLFEAYDQNEDGKIFKIQLNILKQDNCLEILRHKLQLQEQRFLALKASSLSKKLLRNVEQLQSKDIDIEYPSLSSSKFISRFNYSNDHPHHNIPSPLIFDEKESIFNSLKEADKEIVDRVDYDQHFYDDDDISGLKILTSDEIENLFEHDDDLTNQDRNISNRETIELNKFNPAVSDDWMDYLSTSLIDADQINQDLLKSSSQIYSNDDVNAQNEGLRSQDDVERDLIENQNLETKKLIQIDSLNQSVHTNSMQSERENWEFDDSLNESLASANHGDYIEEISMRESSESFQEDFLIANNQLSNLEQRIEILCLKIEIIQKSLDSTLTETDLTRRKNQSLCINAEKTDLNDENAVNELNYQNPKISELTHNIFKKSETSDKTAVKLTRNLPKESMKLLVESKNSILNSYKINPNEIPSENRLISEAEIEAQTSEKSTILEENEEFLKNSHLNEQKHLEDDGTVHNEERSSDQNPVENRVEIEKFIKDKSKTSAVNDMNEINLGDVKSKQQFVRKTLIDSTNEINETVSHDQSKKYPLLDDDKGKDSDSEEKRKTFDDKTKDVILNSKKKRQKNRKKAMTTKRNDVDIITSISSHINSTEDLEIGIINADVRSSLPKTISSSTELINLNESLANDEIYRKKAVDDCVTPRQPYRFDLFEVNADQNDGDCVTNITQINNSLKSNLASSKSLMNDSDRIICDHVDGDGLNKSELKIDESISQRFSPGYMKSRSSPSEESVKTTLNIENTSNGIQTDLLESNEKLSIVDNRQQSLAQKMSKKSKIRNSKKNQCKYQSLPASKKIIAISSKNNRQENLVSVSDLKSNESNENDHNLDANLEPNVDVFVDPTSRSFDDKNQNIQPDSSSIRDPNGIILAIKIDPNIIGNANNPSNEIILALQKNESCDKKGFDPAISCNLSDETFSELNQNDSMHKSLQARQQNNHNLTSVNVSANLAPVCSSINKDLQNDSREFDDSVVETISNDLAISKDFGVLQINSNQTNHSLFVKSCNNNDVNKTDLMKNQINVQQKINLDQNNLFSFGNDEGTPKGFEIDKKSMIEKKSLDRIKNDEENSLTNHQSSSGKKRLKTESLFNDASESGLSRSIFNANIDSDRDSNSYNQTFDPIIADDNHRLIEKNKDLSEKKFLQNAATKTMATKELDYVNETSGTFIESKQIHSSKSNNRNDQELPETIRFNEFSTGKDRNKNKLNDFNDRSKPIHRSLSSSHSFLEESPQNLITNKATEENLINLDSDSNIFDQHQNNKFQSELSLTDSTPDSDFVNRNQTTISKTDRCPDEKSKLNNGIQRERKKKGTVENRKKAKNFSTVPSCSMNTFGTSIPLGHNDSLRNADENKLFECDFSEESDLVNQSHNLYERSEEAKSKFNDKSNHFVSDDLSFPLIKSSSPPKASFPLNIDLDIEASTKILNRKKRIDIGDRTSKLEIFSDGGKCFNVKNRKPKPNDGKSEKKFEPKMGDFHQGRLLRDRKSLKISFNNARSDINNKLKYNRLQNDSNIEMKSLINEFDAFLHSTSSDCQNENDRGKDGRDGDDDRNNNNNQDQNNPDDRDNNNDDDYHRKDEKNNLLLRLSRLKKILLCSLPFYFLFMFISLVFFLLPKDEFEFDCLRGRSEYAYSLKMMYSNGPPPI